MIYEIKSRPDRFSVNTDRIEAITATTALEKWKRQWRKDQQARISCGLRSQGMPKPFSVRIVG